VIEKIYLSGLRVNRYNKSETRISLEGNMAQIQEEEFPMDTKPQAVSWWRVFLVGLLFYAIGVGALLLTQNPILFPTVVMIGSFLVPVTFVAFFYDQRHGSKITLPTVFLGFVYGGVLGVIAASLLEPLFIKKLDFQTAFIVGLIEEFVKIIGVLIIARRGRHDKEIDGLILGAAAGMGFAALESSGYAFTSFLSSGGSLTSTVVVMLIRGILSPLGHGTWTAILAAVLFRESREGHFRINLKVIGAYALVVMLHGLWDGVPSALTNLVGTGFDVFLAQAAVGIAGLVVLYYIYRNARRLQDLTIQSQEAQEQEEG
jgi:RsiW-degrading membrane proteinase PrsW (M82 family)